MYAFYIMNYLNVLQKHYTIIHCIFFFKAASKQYVHEFPHKQRSLLLTTAKYRK